MMNSNELSFLRHASVQGAAALTRGNILSPFSKLRALLEGIKPGHETPIDLTIGEPKGIIPPFLFEKISEASCEFGRYPPIKGTEDLRAAISGWVSRRYKLKMQVDSAKEVLVLNGTREGLSLACVPAVARKSDLKNPAILMCNPYYSAYLAGALGCGAEAVFLDATHENNFLPNLDELEAEIPLLTRTAALFICSPANPQGTVANKNYILKALKLGRKYNFMVFLDECYSEIYTEAPPLGGLEVAAETTERFNNLVIFNSLSKRSNVPGLRSGFCAGDPHFLEIYSEIRNMCGPQVPGPLQYASAAVWAEETHVVQSREDYRKKFALADRILGNKFGYRRPDGGFCLWLDMSHLSGGISAAVTLWKAFGVKVIPGAFLAQPGRDGRNPGQNYVRVALVQSSALVEEALKRIVSVAD
ncbi:MAG: aminotransferase class I/II-fold pyridoxal phosphate-dependent enzyme [Hyphomicrobium sp.]